MTEPTDTEILEFLLNQFKPHSLKMNGESDWVFINIGFPMNRAKGKSIRDVVINAMKGNEMTDRVQKVMNAFYFTFADERQDFIVQKLNNDAIANVLREVINQLQQSPGVIMCADVLELCEELEEL